MAVLQTERRDPGIAVVTLNDPDRRNAMTEEMGRALADAAEQLAGDDELRCVVVTGAGAAFSAGGDLGMLEGHARATREDGFAATSSMRTFYRLFLRLRDVPVPVVAAVNGHAVGAGACVALACDLMVIAEDARFGLNFARIGIHPGMGGSWLLPRLAGRQRAAELLYTGRLATGTDIASYGVALEALPASGVLDRVLGLARDIATSAPLVVRQLKRSLRDTWDRTLEEQLEVEAAFQAENYATDDVVEGLAAVRDGRVPRFTGR